MLVHFPLACWILGVACDISDRLVSWPPTTTAATLNAAACVLALPAMATGLIEFVRLGDDPKILRRAYWHMGLVSLAWTLFASALLLQWTGTGWNFSPTTVDLVLSMGGLAALVAGAWHGADLVYRHGVGIALADSSASRKANPLAQPNEDQR